MCSKTAPHHAGVTTLTASICTWPGRCGLALCILAVSCSTLVSQESRFYWLRGHGGPSPGSFSPPFPPRYQLPGTRATATIYAPPAAATGCAGLGSERVEGVFATYSGDGYIPYWFPIDYGGLWPDGENDYYATDPDFNYEGKDGCDNDPSSENAWDCLNELNVYGCFATDGVPGGWHYDGGTAADLREHRSPSSLGQRSLSCATARYTYGWQWTTLCRTTWTFSTNTKSGETRLCPCQRAICGLK